MFIQDRVYHVLLIVSTHNPRLAEEVCAVLMISGATTFH